MQRRDVLQVSSDLLTKMPISFVKEQSKTFCNYYVLCFFTKKYSGKVSIFFLYFYLAEIQIRLAKHTK